MKHRIIFFIFFCAITPLLGKAQTYSEYGTLLRFSLKNAPFPHPKRADGHTYQNQKFPSKQHYQDSSVLVFIPKDHHFSTKTDIVVHFHGWYNHIDSVLSTFKLIEQLEKYGVWLQQKRLGWSIFIQKKAALTPLHLTSQ